MSWVAAGTFIKDMFKSPWMRNQAPHVLVLFVLLGVTTAYVFEVQPRERAETRASWQQLRQDIQAGYERIEEKHSGQIAAISNDRREERAELMKLILREKVRDAASAFRGLAEQVVSAGVGDNEP